MKYLFLLLFVFLLGCSGKADTTAAVSTARQFYEALKANKIDVARRLVIDKDNLPSDGSLSFNIEKFELTNATVNGSKASLTTKTTNNMGVLTFDTLMKQQNGQWKVNMLATMKNMMHGALEKGQTKGKVELSIEKQ